MTDRGLPPFILLNPVAYITNLLQYDERSCPWTCQLQAGSFTACWIAIQNLCPQLLTSFLGHSVVIVFFF